MAFDVQFVPGATPPGHRVRSETFARDDDYFDRVLKACGILAEVDGSTFRLAGFGIVDWRLDIGYDMSTFVESLPDLVTAMEASEGFVVDLYSQGVECDLQFSPTGTDVQIRCIPWADGHGRRPATDTETIERASLIRMLRRLQHDVARGLAQIDPALARVDPFATWSSNTV